MVHLSSCTWVLSFCSLSSSPCWSALVNLWLIGFCHLKDIDKYPPNIGCNAKPTLKLSSNDFQMIFLLIQVIHETCDRNKKAPKETFILKPCDSEDYSKRHGHFFSDLLEALLYTFRVLKPSSLLKKPSQSSWHVNDLRPGHSWNKGGPLAQPPGLLHLLIMRNFDFHYWWGEGLIDEVLSFLEHLSRLIQAKGFEVSMAFLFGILIKVNTSKGIGKPQFPKNSAQKSIRNH